jgi:hypothetical protein
VISSGPSLGGYRVYIQYSIVQLLENFAVPQIPPSFIFQQDGAPPHFHRDVTTFLDETFPGRWVGRGGPTAWPPRSPELTTLDFFAWGFIKDVVYRSSRSG